MVGEFIGHGHVRRAHLGLAAQTMTLPRRIVAAVGKGPQAARISEIEADGPAGRGGLVSGDVILALDGLPVGGVDDLIRLLGADRIDRSVEVQVLRNGRVETFPVTPTERRAPSPPPPPLSSPPLRGRAGVGVSSGKVFEEHRKIVLANVRLVVLDLKT